jgi:hypothetical protein
MAGGLAGLASGRQQVARGQCGQQRFGRAGQGEALIDRARSLHRCCYHCGDRGQHSGDDSQRD